MDGSESEGGGANAGADGDRAGGDCPAEGPLTDVELRSLVGRARSTDDALLRRLVTSYVRLRRITADVVAFIQTREGGAAVASTPLLRRARALVDGSSR